MLHAADGDIVDDDIMDARLDDVDAMIDSEGAGVLAGAFGAYGIAFDGDGASIGRGERPFDADGPRAGAEIPEQRAARGAQSRECRSPHVAFRDEPVIAEPRLGAARNRPDDVGRAQFVGHLDADEDEVGNRLGEVAFPVGPPLGGGL